MVEMREVPEPMATERLADFLEHLSNQVRRGDSLEGFVEYSLADPDDPALAGHDPATTTMVRARVRTGNRNGQGGLLMFGKLMEVPYSSTVVLRMPRDDWDQIQSDIQNMAGTGFPEILSRVVEQ